LKHYPSPQKIILEREPAGQWIQSSKEAVAAHFI